MKIVDSGTVIASRPKTDGVSCCFPSICVMPSGRWLAGFRLGPSKFSRTQRALISASDDHGKTWSTPIEPTGPAPILDGQPGMWRAVALTPLGGSRLALTLCREEYSNPMLPMFNEQTEGLMDMKIFTAISEDSGQSFSKPSPVDCGKYRDQPTPTTGPLLLLPDGRWAVQFEVNKHYNDPTPWQHASAIVFSSDEGRTWDEVVDIHTDPQRRLFCWDQRLAFAGSSLIDLFWTFDRSANTYLNIHSRISHDGGHTWGSRTDTGIPGQPARLVALDEHRWIMVHVDRTDSPAIKARLSTDGGKTWPQSNELLIHDRPLRNQTWNKGSMQDAWAEMSAFSIGRPDAVPLSQNQALAVWYTGQSSDATDIQWACIQVD
jgi:hypothetical protein